jgi:hypothetical protein
VRTYCHQLLSAAAVRRQQLLKDLTQLSSVLVLTHSSIPLMSLASAKPAQLRTFSSAQVNLVYYVLVYVAVLTEATSVAGSSSSTVHTSELLHCR